MRALILFAFVASAASIANAQNAENVASAANEPTLELTEPLGGVWFRTGSAVVDSRGHDELADVAAWARAHPWRLLAIQGFADHTGGDEMNLRLSQDRTDAVRTALIDLGVEPERIVAVAYGERDRPVRRAIVRGTLGDFRELVLRQDQIHTPAPRGTPRSPTRPDGRPEARARPPVSAPDRG